jgi:hypothetical protein
MRAVTSRWNTAIVNSHKMVSKVDIWFGGIPIVTGLKVVDGTVTKDSTALVLGRCDLTFAEPTRLPKDAGDPLSPFGYEAYVQRGIDYLDGSAPELMPQGVFPIQTSKMSGTTLLRSVSLMDRAQMVVDADFEDAVQIAAGTNFATAIQTVISGGVSGLTYAFGSTTLTTPLLTFPAFSGRWKAAQMMARSIGMRLYFDGVGQCVLTPEPDVRTVTPVWTVAESVPGTRGVLVSIDVEQTRADTYNKVTCVGQNAANTAQFRGVAFDNDPSSPTYYFGNFGKKPRQFTSALIGSQAQADAAAAATLTSQLGLSASVTLGAVPNPALEAGDPILVKRAALGINEVHLADKITIGLSPGSVQSIDSRARQTV